MLEKPDLQDEKIIACLQDEYSLLVQQVVFLPFGADQNTAVYRVVADDETPYFLKLRSGGFDETSVALPKFLSDQGIAQIIAPFTTKIGQLWASLDTFNVILYPFVEGHNGYEVDMSNRNWGEFGSALKRVHTTFVPRALIRRIQRETYSPQWRDIVKTFLESVEKVVYTDPVAVELAGFLKTNREEVLDLVKRAARLAQVLRTGSSEIVLCHSDLHAGNILIDANEDIYIVDWDDPILAPKERDLMYIGGGLMGGWHSPTEEEILFYRGYGNTQLDPVALAYYRYERVIEDIAVFCEQIFLTNAGDKDREQSLRYLKSNFLPNSTIAIAYQSDKTQGK